MGKSKDTRPSGVLGRQERKGVKAPRKRLYRARAHSNPLNDSQFPVPPAPKDVNWADEYPAFFRTSEQAGEHAQGEASTSAPASNPTDAHLVRFADVGCGFGGLMLQLSPLYPQTLIAGFELRDKVSEYVKERIAHLRKDSGGEQYQNVTCIRTNAMKYLVNYFQKAQLQKLFFLFPDPHFKLQNHRRRIISRQLLAEYAYLLAPGGWLYTVTDVQELGNWMRDKLEEHPLFEKISEEELAEDPAAGLLTSASEEAQKVARNSGQTWRHVYRRVKGPNEI